MRLKDFWPLALSPAAAVACLLLIGVRDLFVLSTTVVSASLPGALALAAAWKSWWALRGISKRYIGELPDTLPLFMKGSPIGARHEESGFEIADVLPLPTIEDLLERAAVENKILLPFFLGTDGRLLVYHGNGPLNGAWSIAEAAALQKPLDLQSPLAMSTQELAEALTGYAPIPQPPRAPIRPANKTAVQAAAALWLVIPVLGFVALACAAWLLTTGQPQVTEFACAPPEPMNVPELLMVFSGLSVATGFVLLVILSNWTKCFNCGKPLWNGDQNIKGLINRLRASLHTIRHSSMSCPHCAEHQLWATGNPEHPPKSEG